MQARLGNCRFEGFHLSTHAICNNQAFNPKVLHLLETEGPFERPREFTATTGQPPPATAAEQKVLVPAGRFMCCGILHAHRPGARCFHPLRCEHTWRTAAHALVRWRRDDPPFVTQACTSTLHPSRWTSGSQRAARYVMSVPTLPSETLGNLRRRCVLGGPRLSARGLRVAGWTPTQAENLHEVPECASFAVGDLPLIGSLTGDTFRTTKRKREQHS